jgi:hypothetical protein
VTHRQGEDGQPASYSGYPARAAANERLTTKQKMPAGKPEDEKRFHRSSQSWEASDQRKRENATRGRVAFCTLAARGVQVYPFCAIPLNTVHEGIYLQAPLATDRPTL